MISLPGRLCKIRLMAECESCVSVYVHSLTTSPRQYVDEDTSKRLNLTFASENAFILRADHKEVLNPSGPGRKSVRIQSKKKFIKHVAV